MTDKNTTDWKSRDWTYYVQITPTSIMADIEEPPSVAAFQSVFGDVTIICC